jgi:hypothetical protein
MLSFFCFKDAYLHVLFEPRLREVEQSFVTDAAITISLQAVFPFVYHNLAVRAERIFTPSPAYMLPQLETNKDIYTVVRVCYYWHIGPCFIYSCDKKTIYYWQICKNSNASMADDYY